MMAQKRLSRKSGCRRTAMMMISKCNLPRERFTKRSKFKSLQNSSVPMPQIETT
jgi:hypothetical protein